MFKKKKISVIILRKLEWSPLGNFSGREIGSGERVNKIKFLFVVVERDTLLFYYKSISFQPQNPKNKLQQQIKREQFLNSTYKNRNKKTKQKQNVLFFEKRKKIEIK